MRNNERSPESRSPLQRLMPGGALVLLMVIGCTNPEAYYQVAREQRAAVQELITVLGTIQDEKSMAEAKSALADRFEKFEAIAQKAKALPNPPPPEVQKRFEEDAPALQRSMKTIIDEMKRVRDLKGGKEFFKQFESKHSDLLSAVQP